FCDNQHEEASRLLLEMSSLNFIPGVFETMNWTTLLRKLPSLELDMLLICSQPPFAVIQDFADFRSGLIEFRRKNPLAAALMMTLYSNVSEAGIRADSLRDEGLLALESGPLTHNRMLELGVGVLESRL